MRISDAAPGRRVCPGTGEPGYRARVATFARLVEERTDLGRPDIAVLAALVGEWSLLSDLSLSDLVLWVPTWNDGGLVAVAQVRPTTAPTSVPDDVVGAFAPRGRHGHLDQAAAFARAVTARDAARPRVPLAPEAYPVSRAGRVIAVVSRHAAPAPRVAGRLEEVYLSTADDLLGMLVDGHLPTEDVSDDPALAPRVGDGLIRIDEQGVVEYASPNAVSALRRLGLATDLVGSSFSEVAMRLSRRLAPMDEGLSAVAGGRTAGRADIENSAAAVLVRGIPLIRQGRRIGGVLFVQDATDLRRRERALISKDATIREIHHRVKNNLQTVAAMLRLQARRATSPETRAALAEAELRVAAIAVVHGSLSAEDGERVDFDEIVDRLIALVRDAAPAYHPTGQLPVLVREGTWGTLPADLATPLAMVASELLHNAVEHAAASSIRVALDQDDEVRTLRVQDDGRGLPEGFDPGETGLGLGIVQSLVSGDLGGTCVIEGSSTGTSVTVRVARGEG